MAGGSPDPEDVTDQQCQHCGLYYASEGVLSHEENCDFAGHDVRLQELEDDQAKARAGLVNDTQEVHDLADGAGASLEDDLEDEETVVDVAPGPGPDPGATPPGDPAETDGGQRADLPSFEQSFDPEEHLEDDDDDGGEDDEEPVCEKCGGPVHPMDVLPDRVLEEDPELREQRGVCLPCSMDDEGNWTSPIEVLPARE